jgi:hypothetical protein
MLFKEIIAVFSEKKIKRINTFCGQNAELMIVKTGGQMRRKHIMSWLQQQKKWA